MPQSYKKRQEFKTDTGSFCKKDIKYFSIKLKMSIFALRYNERTKNNINKEQKTK